VRQFQFTEWPEQGVPKSGEGFIDFIGQVHKTKEQFGQEGPITIHCSAGVGRTGVFITLSIALERMRYENLVDMFQVSFLSVTCFNENNTLMRSHDTVALALLVFLPVALMFSSTSRILKQQAVRC